MATARTPLVCAAVDLMEVMGRVGGGGAYPNGGRAEAPCPHSGRAEEAIWAVAVRSRGIRTVAVQTRGSEGDGITHMAARGEPFSLIRCGTITFSQKQEIQKHILLLHRAV